MTTAKAGMEGHAPKALIQPVERPRRNFPYANNCISREALRTLAGKLATLPTWAEFGVYQGESARHLLAVLPEHGELHLFDWFKGLPEPWDTAPTGKFACERPVFNDDRVRVHEGLFEDVLDGEALGPLGLCHIDCDLYSSAVTVLNNVQLVPGSVLIFDEFIPEVKGEYQAFKEWEERTEMTVVWKYESWPAVAGVVQ
jgi:predicted O-methyltransferase YrrM